MPGNPQVSFIVPLLNGLRYTQVMVASLRQSLPKGLVHEIILVDDGSTDGTREWMGTLAGAPFVTLWNESNLGYARANNRAAGAAQGKRLCFLNNDLVLEDGWWEPMVEAHRRLGGRAGIVGNVQRNARSGEIDHAGLFINHKGKPEHNRRRPMWPGWRLRSRRRVPAVTGACFVVGADLWTQLGGFDEGYVNGCEDVDLCFRALDAGRVNVVELRSVVRHHVSSSEGRKARDEQNSYRLARRWAGRLVELGQPDWCRAHFEEHLSEPRDFPDARLAREILLYRWGLRRKPPRRAEEGMRAALAIECARWRELFGESP